MEQKIFCVKTYHKTMSFKIVQKSIEDQLQYISKQESDFQVSQQP